MKLNQVLLRDVRNAYSDCNGTKHERNLNFRASDWVSIDEAVEMMGIALGERGSYGNFRPELLERLSGHPEIILARECSVCIYVVSLVTLDECVTKDLLNADECQLKTIDFDGQKITAYRIWWD